MSPAPAGNGRPAAGRLAAALRSLRTEFVGIGLFSCAVNLLMLTGPLFMLQVYDRVLPSRSTPTLVALLGLTAGLYAFQGLFDYLRVRVLSRAGYRLDDRLLLPTFRTWVLRGTSADQPDYKPLSDLSTLKGFLSSPALLALFDLPWFPVYLAVVFLLHVKLGLLATGGALIVVTIAIVNDLVTRKPLAEAMGRESAESRLAEQSRRNAETVVAMGMTDHVAGLWRQKRLAASRSAQIGGERSEAFSTASKAIRLLLQSAILGLGAWLAIGQEISAGMIVAASIISGRALAPIDQAIGGWRTVVRSRLAYRRLSHYLAADDADAGRPIELPEPQGRLEVRNMLKRPPPGRAPGDGTGKPILSGLNFTLDPGDGLGVIGPSASGKSTLARLLVGLWMPDGGHVRLDGATFEQWDASRIGPHIGYLPQEVEFLPGTIAQNISRFHPEAQDSDIVAAARMADVHDMILRLPDGYGTQVDTALSPLSGGQKQRIALARAVYRTPRLVVLDEPNSNLDAEGDAALADCIRALRASGSVVIVMAHRPSAISAVDKILMLNDGRQVEFGPKEEVLRRVTRVAAQ